MTYQDQQKELLDSIEARMNDGSYGASLVKMRDDYDKDSGRALGIIKFLSQETAEIVNEKIIEPLKKIDPDHYFYPPGSLHLTIKGIRVINDPPSFTKEDIDKADELLAAVIPSLEPFAFLLEGVVKFPTSASLVGYSSDQLKKIVSTLDQGLKDIGVPDNKKYLSDEVFFGNISICRFTHQLSEEFIQVLESLREVKIGDVLIDDVSLVVCDAVCSKDSTKVMNSYNFQK